MAGESSCGKTTLIKVISGTMKNPLKVESGSVNYSLGLYEVDMLHISLDEMRRNVRWKEISYVMQGSMSVLNPVRKIIRTFEDIVDTHEGIPDKKKFFEQAREQIALMQIKSLQDREAIQEPEGEPPEEVLAWARALSEFGATMMFAGNFPGRTQTLTQAVMTALESDLETAVAVSVLSLGLAVVALLGAKGLAGQWRVSVG